MHGKLYTYVGSGHFQCSVNCCRNITKLELTPQEKALAFRTIYFSVFVRILSDLLLTQRRSLKRLSEVSSYNRQGNRA